MHQAKTGICFICSLTVNFTFLAQVYFMKKLLFLLTSLLFFSISYAQKNEQNTSAGITIDLPLINNASFYSYNIDGTGENKNQTGYLGSGFAFFYKNDLNKFSIGYENPSANKSLFPPKGGNRNMNVNIFEATIHHNILSQVALIGGVNYSIYRYHLYTDIPSFSKVDKKDETVGLTAGAEFVPAQSFSFAVTYRPSLFSFEKKAYRAIFSLGLRYDIDFWKIKNG